MRTQLGKTFAAIADPTRRRILELLREGELAAGEIADRFAMSKPAISHHLAVLKNAGLAEERREGQRIIYSLVEDSLLETWRGFLCKFCNEKKTKRAAKRGRKE